MNSEDIEVLGDDLNDVHISTKSQQQILNEIVPNAEKKLLQVMVCAKNKRHVYILENQPAGKIRCLPRQDTKCIQSIQNDYKDISKSSSQEQNFDNVTSLYQAPSKIVKTQHHVTEHTNSINKQEILEEKQNKILGSSEGVSRGEVPVRKCRNALINALIKKEQDKNQSSMQPSSSTLDQNKVKLIQPNTTRKSKHNIVPTPKPSPVFDMHAYLMDDSNFVFVPLPEMKTATNVL